MGRALFVDYAMRQVHQCYSIRQLSAQSCLRFTWRRTVAPESAHAQQPPRPELTAEALIEAARAALAKGALDDAEFLLQGVKPGEGNADDLDFLHGSIAMARKDWQAAIARFRAMLARNPNLPRVRLDLALAYFRAGEDGNAAYHFRLALGEKDMPPVVRARALAFLDLIRRRKSWSVTGSVAVAPDTNINAATSARTVSLFGLPARLSEDARQTSGVGLSASVSGGYEWKLSKDVRFRASTGVFTRTYKEKDFNEQIVNLRAGPRFLFEKFDLRPEVTGRIRWLGGRDYSRTVGAELSGNWTIAPTWRLTGSLGSEHVAYENYLGKGRLDSVQLGLSHALDRATLVRADTGFRREVLDLDAHSWREYIVGLSATRELPFGFVLAAGPSFRAREYGAPLPIYGPKARRDRTLAGRVKASNRYVELFGFMPEITVRHERRDSNLDIYNYTRTVVEVGMVRTF